MENTHQVEGRVPHLISCGESSTGAEQESSRAELEEGGEVRRATFLTRREAAGAQSSPGEMDPQRCPGTMWGAADDADSRLPLHPLRQTLRGVDQANFNKPLS